MCIFFQHLLCSIVVVDCTLSANVNNIIIVIRIICFLLNHFFGPYPIPLYVPNSTDDLCRPAVKIAGIR